MQQYSLGKIATTRGKKGNHTIWLGYFFRSLALHNFTVVKATVKWNFWFGKFDNNFVKWKCNIIIVFYAVLELFSFSTFFWIEKKATTIFLILKNLVQINLYQEFLYAVAFKFIGTFQFLFPDLFFHGKLVNRIIFMFFSKRYDVKVHI